MRYFERFQKRFGTQHKYATAFTLTLTVLIPDEERKSNLLFFYFFVVPQKGFIRTFKAFIKPFEAPKKKCKNKKLIYILMQLSEMHGPAGRVKFSCVTHLLVLTYLR